jgi:peptidoglycan/xylan/chitin deacetylase (PgdA/CDA1 family)
MRSYTDWKLGATRDEKFLYRTAPSIVLTFDDYGSSKQIGELLRLLRLEQIRAAFFLQGDWAAVNKPLVARIKRAGHFIGNHTSSHPDLLSLTETQIITEIKQGVQSSLMRPPRGRYNDEIRAISLALGYRIAYWTIDSDDWQGVNATYMSEKILSQLHPGAVILFHLHADNTIQMLPDLISEIRRRGYTIMSPNEAVLVDAPW